MTQIRRDGVLETQPVSDVYTVYDNFGGWQTANNGVLTFAASAACDLVWVRADDGSGNNVIATFTPDGTTPSASAGIPLDDGVPVPVSVATQTVKVFCSGTTAKVKCYGFHY